jgi:hypothetical protein
MQDAGGTGGEAGADVHGAAIVHGFGRRAAVFDRATR